jgi:hypothetical protein
MLAARKIRFLLNNSEGGLMRRYIWRGWILGLAVTAILSAVGVSRASLAIYPTGVDNSFAPLAGGNPDPHYSLAPAGAAAPYPSAIVMDLSLYWEVVPWVNPQDARWIYTANLADSGARGWYVYRTNIDLTGYSLATARINGKWSCDQYGNILFNGVDTGISQGNDQWSTLHPFTISSGFRPGVNTLEFRVYLQDGYDGLVVSDIHVTAHRPSTQVSTLLLLD